MGHRHASLSNVNASATSYRRGYTRRDRASSSGTGAMAARACGRSNSVSGRRLSVRVLQARRGSEPRGPAARSSVSAVQAYFADGGCIIDQPFQPRLPEGMIRCYMATTRSSGSDISLSRRLFRRRPRARLTSGPAGPTHHASGEAPAVPGAQAKMELEWTPQMMQGPRHRAEARCRSSGTPTFSMVRARMRARTLTCCARSMSAR